MEAGMSKVYIMLVSHYSCIALSVESTFARLEPIV